MLRKLMILTLIGIFAALAIGCGDDAGDTVALKPDDVEKARAQLQDLQNEMAEVRRQVNESIVDLETQQMRLQARLKEVQAGFEKLNARTSMLAGALEGAPLKAKAPQKALLKSEKKRGSWVRRTIWILVIAIVVVLFFLRRGHGNDDEDDAEFEDDEIVENTDLGEIRYPGSSEETTDENEDTGETPPKQD